MNRNEVKTLIEKQMPGWTLEEPAEIDAMAQVDAASLRRGPGVSDLRRKFLGASSKFAMRKPTGGTPLIDSDMDANSVPHEVQATVRIRPLDGGESRVADVVNGSVEIVQG